MITLFVGVVVAYYFQTWVLGILFPIVVYTAVPEVVGLLDALLHELIDSDLKVSEVEMQMITHMSCL